MMLSARSTIRSSSLQKKTSELTGGIKRIFPLYPIPLASVRIRLLVWKKNGLLLLADWRMKRTMRPLSGPFPSFQNVFRIGNSTSMGKDRSILLSCPRLIASVLWGVHAWKGHLLIFKKSCFPLRFLFCHPNLKAFLLSL